MRSRPGRLRARGRAAGVDGSEVEEHQCLGFEDGVRCDIARTACGAECPEASRTGSADADQRDPVGEFFRRDETLRDRLVEDALGHCPRRLLVRGLSREVDHRPQRCRYLGDSGPDRTNLSPGTGSGSGSTRRSNVAVPAAFDTAPFTRREQHRGTGLVIEGADVTSHQVPHAPNDRLARPHPRGDRGQDLRLRCEQVVVEGALAEAPPRRRPGAAQGARIAEGKRRRSRPLQR
jgi:hypothetical protein